MNLVLRTQEDGQKNYGVHIRKEVNKMGYRSEVYLKTTTEGWIVIKKFNDSITNPAGKFLRIADVNKTASGFYKIEFHDVKWYEGSFPEVDNFMHAITLLDEQEIPYSYIRLGEETNDIEHTCNWGVDDMPSEIESFEPVVDVNDDNWGGYEKVDLDAE